MINVSSIFNMLIQICIGSYMSCQLKDLFPEIFLGNNMLIKAIVLFPYILFSKFVAMLQVWREAGLH